MRCTYHDPDTHQHCPHGATHAAILELWGEAVWTPYDCTWQPAAHTADFCLAHACAVADQRTRQREEVCYG